MKEEQDYLKDIAAMRTLMERSSRFLSLSGLAGILAGVYALAGAWIAQRVIGFEPGKTDLPFDREGLVLRLSGLALVVLFLALGTAVFLSMRKAGKLGEKIWNPVSRRLLTYMAVPLIAGGFLMLILAARGEVFLLAPASLLFYGLSLFNAGNFTYAEVRSLGLLQAALGLTGFAFPDYGLLCWAIGFGVLHIAYGIYMYYRYER
jgi:hypothetical protein